MIVLITVIVSAVAATIAIVSMTVSYLEFRRNIRRSEEIALEQLARLARR